MAKLLKAHGVKVLMLNKIKYFPENLKSSISLVILTIMIFFIFFVLNNIYGPDPNTEIKKAAQKKI